MLNENRVKGLVALGLSGYAWTNFYVLAGVLGSFLPSVAIAGSAVYAMSRFSETNTINTIESLPNGELKISYFVTPLKTASITCHVNDTHSVCALGNDDLGAEDVESNLLAIRKHSGGDSPLFLTVPADAFRDKKMMEWIYAKKDSFEATNDDFTDLLRE